jgi:hypothetical protein
MKAAGWPDFACPTGCNELMFWIGMAYLFGELPLGIRSMEDLEHEGPLEIALVGDLTEAERAARKAAREARKADKADDEKK